MKKGEQIRHVFCKTHTEHREDIINSSFKHFMI